jgi:hypothetical protein
LLSGKPHVVKQKSFPLTVINYCLLGVGFFILVSPGSPIFHALGGGLSALALAGFSIMRAYKIAEDRRVQLYGEEINRLMQSAGSTPTEDRKP